MQSDPFHSAGMAPCIRTLRLKVKPESYSWLDAGATEVNQVWNYANEVSAKAARPFAGSPKWLSAYDLDKLSSGATEYFEHIGSDTIHRINAEFATRRKQFKKVKLRWRISRRSVFVVDERNTSRTCSSCRALTGPTGLDMIVVRTWVCSECGGSHDRDVNAAINILSAGRSSPSVCGNKLSPSVAPLRQASRLREAGTSAMTAAA
jgi:hypothetical protein